MNDNALSMLKKGLQEPVEKEEEDKYELPERSINDLLYYSIDKCLKLKWYQFLSRRIWYNIIKSTIKDIPPEGITIGLSNLNDNALEVSQSITEFYNPKNEIGLIRVDVKDELAAYLIREGVIKFTESRGTEFEKETITVKASINVKRQSKI